MQQTGLMPELTPVAPPTPPASGAPEFTVNNRELLKELSSLQRIVTRKTTVPILSNIHLQATGGNLLLTASDLDMSLRAACPARVKKEGRCTIPAHKLHDYVRLLEDGDVTIRLLENQWVQIKSGRSHTKMVGLAPESLPTLPLFPAGLAIKLETQPMRYLIERTMFAVSIEESRYTLNGALLLVKPEGIRMVATDGHRLALAEHIKPREVKELRILVPKKALAELNALLNSTPAEHFQFAQDDSTLYFAVGSRLMTCRQIMGSFPNYEAILPKSGANKAVISREELFTALQRVAQFSDEKSNCVRLRIAKNELKVSSSNVETGESEDVIQTNFAGDAKTISFNSQYLLDFLRVVDSDRVRLEFNDGQTANEFRPEDSAEKDHSYRYIVMPLKA